MATTRLHYGDPLELSHTATVAGHGHYDGRPSVLLESTIFYPESGGQLGDQGQLGDARVTDVQLDAEGVVHHLLDLLDGRDLPPVGARVACAVDEGRRRQHMALHTAQHCLSRALLDLHEAVTISSRLGASAPTIDVDLGGIDLRRAVEAQRVVNAIVDQDREVRQFFPVQSELDAMALRKAPRAVDEAVRVVDVRDFDITPCGGTHVTHTSQIELVYVRSVERYKGGTRITFDAGPRARRALLRHRRAILDASSVMKSAPDELLDAVSRLSTRLDESRREAGALRGALADRWAAQLDGDDVVIASLAFADAELLSAVATRLATGRRVVALAASEGDGITVLVACGPDTDWHAGHLMRALCEATGGRGGGRDRNARGRVPPGADWEEALGIALGRAP